MRLRFDVTRACDPEPLPNRKCFRFAVADFARLTASIFRRREYSSIAAATVLDPQAHYSSPQVRLHTVEEISDELIADLRDESPQRGYRAGAVS